MVSGKDQYRLGFPPFVLASGIAYVTVWWYTSFSSFGPQYDPSPNGLSTRIHIAVKERRTYDKHDTACHSHSGMIEEKKQAS